MTLLGKLLRSSAFRTLETLVTIGIGFLMLPFLLHYLGDEVYGIWILVGSITAAFYLFDLGFASAVTRFIASALTKRNRAEASEVSSTAFFIYCALAILIILAAIAAAITAPLITEDSSQDQLIQLLILITGVSLALEFPFKAYAGVISYHVRYDLMSATRVAVKLIATTATVIAVINGRGIIAVALIGLMGSLVANLAFRLFSLRLEPELRIGVSHFRSRHLRELFSFSAWSFLIDVSRLLQERAPIWSVGYFLGPQLLTVFYVGQRLVEYTFQFLYRAVSMYTPILTRDYTNNNMSGFKMKLLIFIKLNVILATAALASFASLGEPLIKLWMGSQFDSQQAFSTGLLLLFGKMFLFISMPINSAFLSLNKPRIMSTISIAETIVLIILIITLPKLVNFGIVGIALAVFLSYLITRLFLIPFLIARELNMNTYEIILPWFRPIAVSSIACILTSQTFKLLVPEYGILTAFVIGGLIIFLFFVLTLPLLLSNNECDQLQAIIPEKWMRLMNWPRKLFNY